MISVFFGVSRCCFVCWLCFSFLFRRRCRRCISVAVVAIAGLFCRVLFQVVFTAMRVSLIARSRIISPEMSLSLVIFPGVIFLSSYVFLFRGCLLPRLAMELQDLRGVGLDVVCFLCSCWFFLFCCFSRSSCCLFGWAFLSALFFCLCAGCFGSLFVVFR